MSSSLSVTLGPVLAVETRAEALAAGAELCPCVNKVSSSFPGSWENGENGQAGGKLQGRCCWTYFRAPAVGGGEGAHFAADEGSRPCLQK